MLLKLPKSAKYGKCQKKESFQIRKVFRKGKFSNEESAEAKANKESSVRRLFEIQIADLSFLVQRCAHTAAVISSYLGSKISKRCSSSSAFNIQISKEAPPKKECMDKHIFPFEDQNSCILPIQKQSARFPLLRAICAPPSFSATTWAASCTWAASWAASTLIRK